MYTVELYARVRRVVLVEGISQRAVAREYGLARMATNWVSHKILLAF
jgi:hypothetical protein